MGIEINRSTGINANNETGDWGNYASMNSFYFNLLLVVIIISKRGVVRIFDLSKKKKKIEKKVEKFG